LNERKINCKNERNPENILISGFCSYIREYMKIKGEGYNALLTTAEAFGWIC